MSVSITFTNEGLFKKIQILDTAITGTGSVGLSTDTFGDLTTVTSAAIHRPTFPGYADQVPVVQGTGVATDTLAAVTLVPSTFTCSATVSPQTCNYSFLAVSTASSGVVRIMGISPLASPAVVSQIGDSVIAQLTVTDQRV